MSVAIGITVYAGLGTTTISSLPVVWTEFSNFSLGTTTIIFNCILIAAQALILRSKFKASMLFQVVWAVLFGFMCDLSLWLTSWAQTDNYVLSWVWVIVGTLLMSFGVFIQILPNIAFLAGEGFVSALVTVLPKIEFGTMKQIIDWTFVTLAAVLSYVTMGALIGVREGTIFAALFIGFFVTRWRTLYVRSIGH